MKTMVSNVFLLFRKNKSSNSLSEAVLFSAGIALVQLKKHPAVNQSIEIDICNYVRIQNISITYI